MALTKVRDGDDFSPSAEAWNAFIDAANATKMGPRGRSGIRGSNDADGVTSIVVKNIGDDPIDRFHAVGIFNPTVSPDDNLYEFQRRIVMDVDVATEDSVGHWCVVQEPIAAGKFGIAVFSGVTICRIMLTDITHIAAEIAVDSTVPESDTQGLASILWVDGGVGSATTTGQQWAVIRLGDTAIFPKGEFQFQSYVMVSQQQPGFDYIRAHPATP